MRELAGDRESQAGAAGLACSRRIGAVEALEDVREVLGRNAGAGVAHLDGDVGFRGPRPNADLAAGGSMGDRVVEKDAQDLRDPFRVRPRRGRFARLEHEAHVRLPGPRGDRAGRAPNGVVDGDLREVEPQPSGFGERQLLEILDQARKQHRLFMEGVEGGAIGGHEPVLKALDLAAEVRQRRAELVGDVGDHPAAQHLPALEGSGERIEGVRELADLVPRPDRDALRQVPALHPSRGASQRLDGAEDPAREGRHCEEGESGAKENARDEPAVDASDELRLFKGGVLAGKTS